MEHHITQGEFALLLVIFWLPILALSAAFQWFMLSGRRWRATCVAAAFVISFFVAAVIMFSPVAGAFSFLGGLGDFFALGSVPLQSGLLSALLVTVAVLILLRFGLPPNNSFKPNPLRGSA